MKINKYLAPNLAIFIPLSITFTAASSILLVLSSALSMYRNKFIQALKHPVSIAVFIFVGLYLVGGLYSIGSANDINLALRKASRLLYIPLLMPVFMDATVRRNTLFAFIISVSVAAITSVFYRKDPIFLSLFVAFSIFILAHYSLAVARYRWIYISTGVALTYYLFFINTGRVGQLLFFVLFALFMWQAFRRNVKVWIASAIILMLGVSALLYFPNTFVRRYTIAAEEIKTYFSTPHDKLLDHQSSTGLRMLLWRNTLQIIQVKPIFGWGSGGYTQAYVQVDPPENIDKIEKRANPHNQYLLVMVELGIVGFLSLLYLFFCLAREFLKSSTIEAKLGFGLVAAMLIGCSANSWLLDFASMHFFALFAALFLGGLLNKA